AVGIDPGLISIITTDQGREVKPPKLYRKQQAKLKRLQRKASRHICVMLSMVAYFVLPIFLHNCLLTVLDCFGFASLCLYIHSIRT
ncbi:MAG: hypothetical protein ACKPFA_36695, partial [Dolichospermum sp.]